MSRIPVDEAGELFISDLTTAVEQSTREFDRVINIHTRSIEQNVSGNQKYSWYDVETHDSVDSYRAFERAANELHDGGEGMDGSVSVALAAIGGMEGLGRARAMGYVHRYRIPESYPSLPILRLADRYLSHFRSGYL